MDPVLSFELFLAMTFLGFCLVANVAILLGSDFGAATLFLFGAAFVGLAFVLLTKKANRLE
ncbi:hypothetical protein PF005_g7167 [Phytophthora fragariae]|uniref:Uncharacterized protein n=1 Tax=Phytophthora fragariae TaxID=53985 RepID=A0A6A3YQH4_9STRA|nr:hypothetical protein PF003_g28197 [Phytophthora fragariae]KAE8942649.1 hypothetical protein PF009_g7603 [Phytophthora fragariae]KAE9122321.1 hypothetical protein PF007_g7484 [Phytophthora fragariae]KAE9221239.1 hypothetical protein PF005_g7167 [Phytophthora fragariae]KAE9243284.1 hypothetical protein PF004_g6221 [Phytophthora fragariae]